MREREKQVLYENTSKEKNKRNLIIFFILGIVCFFISLVIIYFIQIAGDVKVDHDHFYSLNNLYYIFSKFRYNILIAIFPSIIILLLLYLSFSKVQFFKFISLCTIISNTLYILSLMFLLGSVNGHRKEITRILRNNTEFIWGPYISINTIFIILCLSLFGVLLFFVNEKKFGQLKAYKRVLSVIAILLLFFTSHVYYLVNIL